MVRRAADHRVWLGPAVALLFALALTWGLVRFGAAELPVLYWLFLWLVVSVVLALSAPPWREPVDPRLLGIGLIGVFLLGSVALQPNLEARGTLHLAVGWIALWLGLWLSRRGSGLRRFLIVLLVLLGALEAFYGLVQAVGGIDYIGSYFRNRGRLATGTLINRNHFAALLNMILPLGLGMLFASQARKLERRVTRSEALAKTWIVLLGSSVMGVAVLLSQSRGGTLSLLMTLLFMALLLSLGRRRVSRRGLTGVAIAVLLFLVVGMGAAFGLEALFERFGRIEENLSRVEIYGDTLGMIAESPWVGVGPGMYRWTFRTYQDIQPEKLYDHAHNDYLETAAEWGLPLALLGWGLVFWRFLRSALLSLRSPDPWRRGLALGTAGALFSILIHSLVDFSLQIPAILMVFGCIVALAWSLDLEESISLPVVPALPAIVLRGLLLVALLASGWSVLERARASQAARPVHGIPGLERALKLDPSAPEPHFLLGMAYRDLPGLGTTEQALDQLRTSVRLNPYAWRYWLELSATQELEGDLDGAQEALEVAVRLNPGSGAYRWRLGNLVLRHGATDQAVAEIRQAVRLEPHLAEAAVVLLLKTEVGESEIRELLPADRLARLRVFRQLLRRPVPAPGEDQHDELLRDLWSGLLADPEPLTVAEGRGYVDRLWKRGSLDEARAAWLELARVHGSTDPDYASGANRVWNGAFELEPIGPPFGWRLGTSDAFTIETVDGDGIDGSRALRIAFKGTENLDFSGVSQELILEPETTYQLAFELRTESLSTDQGMYIEVFSGSPRQRLGSSPPQLGTQDWAHQEIVFTTPTDGGPGLIRLRRNPSRRLDNKLNGTVWVDSVRIERVKP